MAQLELAQYKANSGIWQEKSVHDALSIKGMNAILWWRGICDQSKLGKVAVGILSLPPTSAATERSFSTFSWIHSTKRNRLTLERSSKITYIAHNLKLLDYERPTPETEYTDEESSDGDNEQTVDDSGNEENN